MKTKMRTKMKNLKTLILIAVFGLIAAYSNAQNSVTVTVYPLPTITLDASAVSVCSGTTSVNLSYSATTQTPTSYSIDFNAAANTAGFVDIVDAAFPVSPISITVPGGAAAATYNANLTLKNGNGCISNAYAITVTVNTIPGAATISANSRCGTGTVLMTAGIGANGDRVDFSTDGSTIAASDAISPYEYTTSSITAGSSQTIYVRTYNTTTGCYSAWTNSATATANTIPTADAGADPGDITCANPTRTLSGSGGGTYSWSTADGTIDSGAATATPTISAGGTYSLTVTVGGCASTNSATVVVGQSTTTPDVATISDNTRCGTGTVLMTAGIGANGDRVDFSTDGSTVAASDATSPYEYTTSSITAGSSQTIYVRTYNTSTGCASAWTNTATATANTIPTADAGADPGDITCANPTRTLSGSGGGIYSWSTVDGTIDSGAATATPTISAGGTYSLTVTVNGCSSTNTAEVVVGETGTIPAVATISDNTRCGTGTVLMTAGIGVNGDRVDFSTDGSTVAASDATSPYEYTTSSITAGSSQTIYVRTFNTSTGCYSAWTNSATATAYVIPTVTIASGGDICNGVSTNLTFTLTGTANWTIKYSDGTTTTTINNVASSPHTISVNPTSTTTYTLTEVSDANCTNTAP